MTEMQKQKERVALISIASSGLLAIGKFVIGALTGSIGLISDGVHSSSDFVATVVTWWAIRVSGKPADEGHHFGHGKMESMAALFEVLLLFGAAGWIAFEAGKRLLGEPHTIESARIAIAALVVSIVVDFWRVQALRKVAKATGSPALEADALHFLSDMLASAVVLVGMILVAYGYGSADAVAALIVACFILVAAVRLGQQSFNALVDAAPSGTDSVITALVSEIPEVARVERVRVRTAGATLFIEIAVTVGRSLPLDRVAALKVEINEAVQKRFPGAEVTVIVDPRALDNETIETGVRVIATNQGAAIHRLTIQRIEEKLSIGLDLEVAADMSSRSAHDIASRLEAVIREEFGQDTEIDTHIEPMAANWLNGQEASEEQHRQIEEALRSIAAQGGVIRDVHDIRIRKTEVGLIVNFHCHVQAELPITKAHDAVDEVERKLRTLYPEVARAVGHAEPGSDPEVIERLRTT
jgi:cation diffusion facilitator family transporter